MDPRVAPLADILRLERAGRLYLLSTRAAPPAPLDVRGRDTFALPSADVVTWPDADPAVATVDP